VRLKHAAARLKAEEMHHSGSMMGLALTRAVHIWASSCP
jgi:hypothetical protein